MTETLDKIFRLKENKTNVRKEIAAGCITFMTMAYILAVNPSILSQTGMDSTAVLLATCMASFLGTMLMGIFANLPFALSSGMGMNAFFTYTVVMTQGYSWQMALFAVFVEGIIFMLLSVTNVREAIFNSIPISLKHSVSVGIGLFIAFIGLQNAGLAVDASTLVTITKFSEDFNTHGICAVLALIGTLGICAMYVRKVQGAVLKGILGTWVLGIICQLIGLYVPDNETYFSIIPTFAFTDFTAIGKTFGQCFTIDFGSHSILDFAVIVFSFLFVDLFDTLGTLIGVAGKADMLDKDGKLPNIKKALLSDAIATTLGAVFGTSTVSTFVESAAGVGSGGRTGLTAVTTGLLFLVSMFLAPIFTAIPAFATAPALIFVGFLMFGSITKIQFDSGKDLYEIIPAFFCIICMPLFYSISDGISMGIITYVLLGAVSGNAKKVTPVMYVLAGLFILKYALL